MGSANAANAGRGGGDAGATPRKDSERIRIIRKEYHKEVSKERRLEYGTPYAMRRHKAWRGGSSARQAAFPPPCVQRVEYHWEKGGVLGGRSAPSTAGGWSMENPLKTNPKY